MVRAEHANNFVFLNEKARGRRDCCRRPHPNSLDSHDSFGLLLRTVGVDHCMFGSKNPGGGSTQDPATGRWIDDIHLLIDDIEWLQDGERDQLFESNARKLFRI